MRSILVFLFLSIFSSELLSKEVTHTKDGRMGTKCFPQYKGQTTEICIVSIIQLALTPERYHGKTVRVRGLLSIKHEVTGITSGEHKILVQVSNVAQYSKLDNQRVQVQGKFNALNFGLFGMWDGAIEEPIDVMFVALVQ